MQLVLDLRDKDFALIKFKCANVLDVQPSTKQDLHVLRHLQRIVALKIFILLSCRGYALVVPQLAHVLGAQILMP